MGFAHPLVMADFHGVLFHALMGCWEFICVRWILGVASMEFTVLCFPLQALKKRRHLNCCEDDYEGYIQNESL